MPDVGIAANIKREIRAKWSGKKRHAVKINKSVKAIEKKIKKHKTPVGVAMPKVHIKKGVSQLQNKKCKCGSVMGFVKGFSASCAKI